MRSGTRKFGKAWMAEDWKTNLDHQEEAGLVLEERGEKAEMVIDFQYIKIVRDEQCVSSRHDEPQPKVQRSTMGKKGSLASTMKSA